ncbi:hypothetical protein, partial [Enterococcus faecium]|uniref:hypothetical protein n=1 Tax=Enterococcus faecium TaxID=1352 RepID=UPI001C60A994
IYYLTGGNNSMSRFCKLLKNCFNAGIKDEPAPTPPPILDSFDWYIFSAIRGSVRKMRIYNAKPIFLTNPSFLTTLRKF